MSSSHSITTLQALESLYGATNENSLAKETAALTPAYRRWIEASRFFAISSAGAAGLDCSPRGDAKGQLIRVLDDKTLAIPDRRGNNRLDTLKNILMDPRVGLLFLIPGINETLRINGRATITADPEAGGVLRGERQDTCLRHPGGDRGGLLSVRAGAGAIGLCPARNPVNSPLSLILHCRPARAVPRKYEAI